MEDKYKYAFLTKSEIPHLIEELKKSPLFYQEYDTPEVFNSKLKYDPQSIFIAKNPEGDIVGCAITIYDPWNSFIYHFFVRESLRGNGIGKKLINTAQKHLKDRGAKFVTLFVNQANKDADKLVKMYVKFGFKVKSSYYNMEKNLKE